MKHIFDKIPEVIFKNVFSTICYKKVILIFLHNLKNYVASQKFLLTVPNPALASYTVHPFIKSKHNNHEQYFLTFIFGKFFELIVHFVW